MVTQEQSAELVFPRADSYRLIRFLLGDPPATLSTEESARQYTNSYLLMRTGVGVCSSRG